MSSSHFPHSPPPSERDRRYRDPPTSSRAYRDRDGRQHAGRYDARRDREMGYADWRGRDRVREKEWDKERHRDREWSREGERDRERERERWRSDDQSNRCRGPKWVAPPPPSSRTRDARFPPDNGWSVRDQQPSRQHTRDALEAGEYDRYRRDGNVEHYERNRDRDRVDDRQEPVSRHRVYEDDIHRTDSRRRSPTPPTRHGHRRTHSRRSRSPSRGRRSASPRPYRPEAHSDRSHIPSHMPSPERPSRHDRSRTASPRPRSPQASSVKVEGEHPPELISTAVPKPRSPTPTVGGSVCKQEGPSRSSPIPSPPRHLSDKGKHKVKEETPPAEQVDVEMQDVNVGVTLPHISTDFPPRSPPQAPSSSRFPRSPPRGPRNYLKTPTSANDTPISPFASFHASQSPSWPRRVDSSSQINAIKTERLEEAPTLPNFPPVGPRPSLTPALDEELARLQAHRAHLTAEYVNLARERRRALHELDVAEIEHRATYMKQRLTDSMMEKAKLGMLGIDFEHAQ